MRDSLEYDSEDTDPRLSLAFSLSSLTSSDYDDIDRRDHPDNFKPFAGTPDPSANRRKKRQRHSDATFDRLAPFQYRTVADGDLFRLAVIFPGTGEAPVECKLIWESSKAPKRDFVCLSYCWQTIEREADIIADGFRLPVTKNLLSALQSLRKRTTNLLIWIDQICINQDDDLERGHQVSIMKNIFNQAKEVIVWLGDEDEKTQMLFEYAKKMRRGDESPKTTVIPKGSSHVSPKRILKRIMNPRQLQDAIRTLLQRPWFQRVWVIPEVALARFAVVACGRQRLSWDNLVRLIREVKPLPIAGFDKQAALLGNPRQRIAIITQMTASQRDRLAHTDITQLLILAKSSRATDVRDMIYAFYGLTLLTTFPSYTRSVEMLYAEVIHMYVNSIKWETYYSSWHNLTEAQRTHQLMSILYSAGTLHQHHTLPSWIPDLTFSWHLAPIWCKTTSNILTGSGKDEWSTGVRCDFRAGGDKRKAFEILDRANGMHHLRLSAIIFDSITIVSETTPASTPSPQEPNAVSPTVDDSPTLRYGRTFFRTAKGSMGIATPGVEAGDTVAVILGGDVPVILRPREGLEDNSTAYKLLCECFLQSEAIMQGGLVGTDTTLAEDIVLI